MAILLDHISKSFDEHKALEKVSLEIKDEEILGVIGPDGAGKTTLFRIMASLVLPDEGSCTLQGWDVVKDYREVRKIIGYMPGRFSLYMDLSVEENLAFYASVFGTTISENYELIRDIYQQIEPFRKRLAGQLSGGMKQKLALSCALIHRPKVLILDEPTTGVDAVSRMEFWEMLYKIRQEGITVVVSTPYMDEAAMCDRVALMQKGSMLALSGPGEAFRDSSGKYFSLRSSGGIYPHLKRIRKLPQCKSAWLFGDELHVMLYREEEASRVEQELHTWGDSGLRWSPLNPGIEDYFMELIQEGE